MFDQPTVDLDVYSVEIPVPSISENPLSLTEVMGMICKLKNGKAEDICDIITELLKDGDELMILALHVVVSALWQTGTIPPGLCGHPSLEGDRGSIRLQQPPRHYTTLYAR